MPFDVWTLYVLTVLALMSTPGPSQLLMLSNAARHGFARSTLTAMGDLSANVLQMLAAGLGLAVLIAASAHVLTVIKWAGVAYLIYLGLRMIRQVNDDPKAQRAAPAALHQLWLQGFVTSAANPKAVVFFAALFPQFISADLPFWPQFLILSATYLVVDGAFLMTYGGAAHGISRRLTGQGRMWLDRIGGGLMIGAAVLLGLKTVEEA